MTLKATVRLSPTAAVSTTTRIQVFQGGAEMVAEQPAPGLAEQLTVTEPAGVAEAEPNLRTTGQEPVLSGSDHEHSLTETERDEANCGTKVLEIHTKTLGMLTIN